MLTGVRCHWLTGEEQVVPTTDCVACASTGCNPCGYDLPLITLMVRDRDPAVVGLSSTMFSNCPREQGIKKHHQWTINPDRAYTRAWGSLVHLGAETLSKARVQGAIEQRYGRPFTLPDGRTVQVTAQVDALYIEDDGVTAHIRDYKATKSLAPSTILKKALSYVPQFSIQRYILETAHGLHIASCELKFLAHEGRRVVNLYPDGEPELPGVFLWTHEQTERYLTERAPALADSLAGKLAPPLDRPDEWWRCRNCDVHDLCAQLYRNRLPADQP